jgi:hypothetical protein
MSSLIDFSGEFLSNGRQVSFRVEISMPKKDGPDYFCTVESRELFTRPMNVYGESQIEAVRRAITLVKEVLIVRTMREQDTTDGQLA